MDKKRRWLSLLFGSVIGIISGFFGGGGGMMVVPVLEGVYLLDEKRSHATAMFIILPISIFAGIVAFFVFKPHWVKLLAVSLGVSVGGAIGAIMLKKLKSEFIGYLFTALVFIASLKMIFA
ncbi:MAG: TSUP family transporter [Christensenellaceae bacterium]